MLLLEIKVTSYGALSIGGVASLVLGSLLLFDPNNPFGTLPIRVILPAVIFTVVFFLLIIGLGLAAQRRRHFSGLEALAGETGKVIRSDSSQDGRYHGRLEVSGEIWEYQAGQELNPGQRVKIVGRRGRVLIVEPLLANNEDI
jgi:membrane-bound serine protease (ClpP class)